MKKSDKKMKIKLPKDLIAGQMYNESKDAYCSVGWILKEIDDNYDNGLDGGDYKKLQETLGLTSSEVHEIISGNDGSSTSDERIEKLIKKLIDKGHTVYRPMYEEEEDAKANKVLGT